MIQRIRLRRHALATMEALHDAHDATDAPKDFFILAGKEDGCFDMPEEVEVSPRPLDWLVIDSKDQSAPLARRYGFLRERTVVDQGSLVELSHEAVRPRTVTFVVPFHVTRFSDWIVEQRAWLERILGSIPPTGFLWARTQPELSLLLAKQLAQVSASDSQSQGLAILDAPRLRGTIGTKQLLEHRGPLFVYAHARTHCGRTVQRQPIVFCSSRSEGRDGLCVGSTRCYFPEDEKVAIRRLKTTRLFFDACSTATVGHHDLGMPAELNHVTAAFAGNVREFIGNLTVTAVDDLEYDWFVALSALGFRPSVIVEALNVRRIDKLLEHGVSLVYFGDAVNEPWPCNGASVSLATLVGRSEVSLDCREADLIAVRITERDAAADIERRVRIDGLDEGSGPIEVAVFRESGTDQGAILVRGEPPHSRRFKLMLDPQPRAEPVVGPRLSIAVREVQFLETLPEFSRALRGAGKRLERELIELIHARDAILLRGARAVSMRDLAAIEGSLSCQFDSVILAAALERAVKPWDVEAACSRVGAPPARTVACMHCQAKATLVELRSPLGLARYTLECPRCFVVYVVPAWPLEAQLVSRPRRKGRSIELTFDLQNVGDRERMVSIAMHVDGTPRAAKRVRPIVKKLQPGERFRVDLRFASRAQTDNFRRSKMFVASEGTFGYYAVSTFFADASEREHCAVS